MSMDFVISTDLTVFNQPIQSNFEEMKAYLTAELADYQNMVVTEDQITFAKEKRAAINKLSKRINEYKIGIKKQVTEPVTRFEGQCKELIAICDKASGALDRQVKEYEERAKAEKKADIAEYFSSAMTPELSGMLDLNAVWNEKWLNRTYEMDDIHAEISKAISEHSGAVEAIRSTNSPFEAAMLDDYRQHHDLTKAMQTAARLQQQQEEIDRRKAEQEEIKRRLLEAKEREKAAAEAKAKEPVITEVHKTREQEAQEAKEAVMAILNGNESEQPQEKVYSIKLEITGSYDGLCALKDYIVRNKLVYKKID